ncbi:putative MORN repeat variant [Tenacibaculum sp. 190524A05c]|uniref:toxin-antitoxin system YwqK family antitoxin n=1 Tax=Tenacibaculum platacis TaxID=3137852 RepID=UPI0031FB15CB
MRNNLFFFISLILLVSCYPTCNNIAGKYYNIDEEGVEHFIQLKSNGEFIQYYKNKNLDIEISQESTWRYLDDDYCLIELFDYSVYKASDIDDYFGETLGTKRANILFFVNNRDLRITRDGSIQFIKEEFKEELVAHRKKRNADNEAFWEDVDTLYYSSGEIKEIGKIVDLPVEKDSIYRKGKWKEFYKNGSIKAEGIYNRRKKGIWKFYYNTGELKAMGNYESNLKVGPWEYYHKNGVIKGEGIHIYIYTDSVNMQKKRGKWRYYNEEGRLMKVKTYKSVEKSLDSLFKAEKWKEEFIKENIVKIKKDWYNPMQEYKAELRKQDSINRSK